MQTFVPLQRVKLLSFVLAVLLFIVGVVAASAQPVRIAVGAASVASLPTWVAQDRRLLRARRRARRIDLHPWRAANHVGADQRRGSVCANLWRRACGRGVDRRRRRDRRGTDQLNHSSRLSRPKESINPKICAARKSASAPSARRRILRCAWR